MASIDDKRMAVDGEKKEEEEFASGPLSVLMHSVKHNTQVLPTINNFKNFVTKNLLRR